MTGPPAPAFDREPGEAATPAPPAEHAPVDDDGPEPRLGTATPTGQGWTALLASLSLTTHPPASREALGEVEARLGRALPSDLGRLYEHSDGVYDEDSYTWLVWPVKVLLEELVRPSHHELGEAGLLAFGTNGAGEWFCVPQDRDRPVLVWYPVEVLARQVADDLQHLLRGWTDGSVRT